MTLNRRTGLGNRRIDDRELTSLANTQLLALAVMELTKADQHGWRVDAWANSGEARERRKAETHARHRDRCWENALDILDELRQRGFPQTDQATYERIQGALRANTNGGR
jgi:hypothetical protein